MSLPKVDRRELLALRFSRDKGGTVRIHAGQRHLAERLRKKGLVTLKNLHPDGQEMTLTPDGYEVANRS